MALITNNAEPYSANYWHIRGLSYDKGTETTTVNIGGYLSADHRTASYPTAYDSRVISLAGDHNVASAYEAIAARPEWAGATSDED